MHKNESPADVVRWLERRSADMLPAILGSLTLRRCPCIRENCPACQSGEQHPSYVLYARLNGRRISIYIPEQLVPEVRRALDNGRAIQDLLYEAATRYVKALKRARATAAKRTGGLRRVEIHHSADQVRRLGVAAARGGSRTNAAGDRRFSR
jgi:hypothetical protein